MTLLARTTARRRRGMAIENVIRSERVETRVSEIALVAEVHSKYEKADRVGDLRVESLIQKVYHLADDEEERTAAAQLLAAWWKSEQCEGQAVEAAVREAVSFLRDNNDFWLGAAVPSGSDGAA